MRNLQSLKKACEMICQYKQHDQQNRFLIFPLIFALLFGPINLQTRAKDEDLAWLLERIPETYNVEGEIVPFVEFSELDDLGRVGPAIAYLGPEYPAGARSDLQSITPSGWIQAYYFEVPGGWLYHRCHLIAHQFIDGDVAENIFTGTEYLNLVSMAGVEREIAAYINRTDHHVYYSVVPFFYEDELVCRSVEIRAWSMEDSGIRLHVLFLNAQPEIYIFYKTGASDLLKYMY